VEIFLDLGLLVELTKRDFTERYAGSVLGVFWTFIWPLVMIFIYTFIFSRVMGAKLPGLGSTYSYGIYLVAGLAGWIAFSNTVTRATNVFVEKKAVISKIRISLPMLPCYVVLSESITYMITMAIYFVFLMIIGAPMHRSLILLPFIFVVQQIFAYSLGLIAAILQVFVKDLKEFVGIVFQIWFWLTPIVYIVDILPGIAGRLMVWNPAFLFIDSYHRIFFYGQSPDLKALLALTFMGHFVFLVAFWMFKRLEKDVRDCI